MMKPENILTFLASLLDDIIVTEESVSQWTIDAAFLEHEANEVVDEVLANNPERDASTVLRELLVMHMCLNRVLIEMAPPGMAKFIVEATRAVLSDEGDK
jgi:hypothetical protein